MSPGPAQIVHSPVEVRDVEALMGKALLSFPGTDLKERGVAVLFEVYQGYFQAEITGTTSKEIGSFLDLTHEFCTFVQN